MSDSVPAIGHAVKAWLAAMQHDDQDIVLVAERAMVVELSSVGVIRDDQALAVDRMHYHETPGATYVRVYVLSRDVPEVAVDLFEDGTVYKYGSRGLH